jgi:serine/threonine-protein kinase PRP4
VLLDKETLDTDELVARFYRAPEVILGLPLAFGVDMWAVGCSLFELFTGEVLFPGRSNADMLKLMMELKGLCPKGMRTAGRYSYNYFDAFNFYRAGLTVPINEIRKERDLGVKLAASSTGHDAGEDPRVSQLSDLLERCLALDPSGRMTPREALEHPFLVL